jgi:antitoxin HicB
MNYHFKIHKDKQGFWAECIEILGCHSQGDTIEELSVNCKEALNCRIF